jgi:phage/plasmid-associated DNA primase
MFEDKTPIQVNRKGKPVVLSRIAKVHIFCANKLPPNFEGGGKAFLRRLTLLKFMRDLTNTQMDKVIKHYEEVIWAAGYEGLLNFCLEGLTDLVNSGGKFFQTASSIGGIEEWQADRDPIQMFLDDLKVGEVGKNDLRYILEPNRRTQSSLLFKSFKEWADDGNVDIRRIDIKRFVVGLENRGFKRSRISNARFILGVGLASSVITEF